MRLKSLVLGALVATGLVVSTGGAASAATAQCSIVAPSKVTIDQPYRGLTTRLAANCQAAGVEYASWQFIHPSQGLQDIAIFDGTTTDPWDVYDWDPTGAWTVRPSSIWAADRDLDVIQNTTTTTVKLGARLTATAKRANGKLTLSTTAKVYSPNANTWVGRSKAKVSLMRKAPGSASWTWVKSATATSTGKVSLTVVPRTGQYRLQVGETPSVWAISSSPVRGK